MANPWILWTNVASDAFVAISYVLFYLGVSWLLKKVRHIPELGTYTWVFAAFKVFILASGVTPVFRIVNVWLPLAQFSLLLKIVSAAASIPAAIFFASRVSLLAASIRRSFVMLASEQLHSEALRKSESFLDRTNRVAGVGGWEVDIATERITWSAETCRIHGAPPSYHPTLEAGLDLYKPEARPIIAAAVEAACDGKGGWDLELPLTTLDGRDIWARCVGVVEVEGDRPVRIVGAFQDITARVAERVALKQANERIEIATDSGHIGIWDWNIVTGDLFCDDWMHRLHGKSPCKVGEDPLWRDHLHPDDRDIVTKTLNDAVAGDAPYDAEFRVLWPDGSVHTLHGAARVTRDSEGRALRMVGANWDVSERVDAEAALRAANERAKIATDSGGIGIFALDVATNTCAGDQWVFRLYNLEDPGTPVPAEFLLEQIHPEDRRCVIDALNDAIAGAAAFDTEFRVIWKDGSVHYIRGTGKVTLDEKGRAATITGANWDVTESRRLTAELAEQHELLRVTLQSIADGVITVDLNRKVTWLNAAAERMTGWLCPDALAKPLSQIFQTLNEESRVPTENPLASRLVQGKAVGICQHTVLISREGSEFSVENAAAPIRGNFGELLGNVLVFRDVTEQRRLAIETDRNAKLKGDLKLKDEFLSHVSHELRSPLTSIYSFTSIIADNLAGETTPDQKQYLQIVLKNVVQLQAMIEDLLTVTQAREGKLTIKPERLALDEAIGDALHTVQSAAATKSIKLSFAGCPGLPAAFADHTRLRQVLIILLDNAIKFTPEGGRVSVETFRKDQDLLLVTVTDTGCGIPADKRSMVFENLYQVTGPEQSDTSRAGRTGLGLGLHIARNLVTRQGGNIWVTEAPVQGSVFNFTLPVFSADAATAPELKSVYTPRRRNTDLLPAPASASGSEPAPIPEPAAV